VRPVSDRARCDKDEADIMRTIILGGAMLGVLLSCAAPAAVAREWGFERGYYPGPFHEPYFQRLPHGRWSGARVPRPHRAIVPPDRFWGGRAAVYGPACKQRVLRKDPYFGWLWTTAWVC